MAGWSFQRKLIAALLVIAGVAIMSSIASLFISRLLVSRLSNFATTQARDLADSKQLQIAGVRNILDARTWVLTGDSAYASTVTSGDAAILAQVAQMKTRIRSGARATLLDNIAIAEGQHQKRFQDMLRAASAPGNHGAVLVVDSLAIEGAALASALNALVVHMEYLTLSGLESTRAEVATAQKVLGLVNFTTILLAIVFAILLGRVYKRAFLAQTTARTTAETGHAKATLALAAAVEEGHLKDEFLATVSHELRNPLAPILTWTQLLRSGTLDKAKSDQALEVIERNVRSQAQLIDDLVDVSRVVSGKFRLDVRPIELAAVIKAAAETQRPASDAKHIRLQLVLDERAGPVSGDSERLQQVMWNLISNAIKFTPKGGRVQVVLERVESHAQVSVVDNGIGIDPTFLPHVFEPFRQATDGSMRHHGGLGLGLSIVRTIIELHGGEIVASSDGPNLGSQFTIKLPILATSKAVARSWPRHPIAGDQSIQTPLKRLDGVRVLVVDDERSTNEALQALLGSCGATVRLAGSAGEALAIFDGWQPDVLISDIAMPGEDGYSLIRKIRERGATRGGDVAALALTAYAKVDDRVSILAAGFQMYLSKPADPHELLAVVSSLASRGDANGEASMS